MAVAAPLTLPRGRLRYMQRPAVVAELAFLLMVVPKPTARFTTAVTPRRRAEGARLNGGKKSSYNLT